MAQITLHRLPRVPHLSRSERRDRREGDRVRSVAPALVAVLLLLGVLVAGGLVLRDWLDFGLWLAAQTAP